MVFITEDLNFTEKSDDPMDKGIMVADYDAVSLIKRLGEKGVEIDPAKSERAFTYILHIENNPVVRKLFVPFDAKLEFPKGLNFCSEELILRTRKDASVKGSLEIQLANYHQPEKNEPFSMDMPIGIYSSRNGIVGKITFDGNLEHGTRLVRSAIDVLRAYRNSLETGGLFEFLSDSKT